MMEQESIDLIEDIIGYENLSLLNGKIYLGLPITPRDWEHRWNKEVIMEGTTLEGEMALKKWWQ